MGGGQGELGELGHGEPFALELGQTRFSLGLGNNHFEPVAVSGDRVVDVAERLKLRLAKFEFALGQGGRFQFGVIDLPVGELPKAGVHLAAWPALHEDFPAPSDEEADEPPIGCRRPLGQGWDGLDLVLLAGSAAAFQRAVAAERIARRADQRA